MSVIEKWEFIGSPLTEFLKEKTTTDNQQITHQLLPKLLNNFPYYKFHIPKEDYSTFIKLYYQHVVEMKKPLSLMEVIGDICPMYLDIDIKYDNPDKNIVDKQYTKETIELICKSVVNEVRKYVDLEPESGDQTVYQAIVMEKPHPIIKENYAKDGIHIIFPNIVIHRKLQQHIVGELCLEENAELTKPIIDTLKSPLYEVKSGDKNQLKYITDESIYKSGKMVMLGSQKPDNVPYEVSQIIHMSEIFEDDTTLSSIRYENKYMDISEWDSYTLLELNSLYNSPDKLSTYHEDTMDYISSNFKSTDTTSTPTPKKTNEDTTPVRNGKADSLIPTDREICKELVKFLNIDRCEDYNSWIKVGLCLKNISSSLLELWKDFSKKSKKYKAGECENRWLNDFKECNYSGSKLTIASLYFWANADSPEAYDKYNKDLLRNDVRIAVKNKGPQADVARVVYNSAKHKFVCAGISTQEWYYFNSRTTRWEYMDGAIMLRRYINDVVTDLFAHYLQEYNDKAKELRNQGEEDSAELWDERAKKCSGIFTNLKTTSFKDNVVKECRDLYYDKNFLNELDANTHLLGFENCVFDLPAGIFRLGEPGDNVSLSCGITIDLYDNQKFPIKFNEYYKTYKKTENYKEYNDDLDDFLCKILPIKEVREYTLRKVASCLIGDIREEKFHIWTGSGGNGKSKLVDLIEKALGDYACKLPVQLLTQKRGQSSGANPELARTQGKRFISMQEPDVKEKINIGLMKELSGGDKVQARHLFKNCVEFKPQFTMFLMCNQLPDVPGDDEGTWRRLEVVEFISKFRPSVKPGDEKFYMYKMDMQLTEKLEKWNSQFLLKLLDIFVNKYNKPESDGGGIIVPDEVIKQTKKYRETNDLISQFMELEYEMSSTKTHISDIYDDFKEWYKESSYDKKNIPKKNEFEEKIIKLQRSCGYGFTQGMKEYNFSEKEGVI